MKIIVILFFILSSLSADAQKVINVAEKSTYRVVNFNAKGAGTGFFINSDGYFITNNHVVEGFRRGQLMILNKYNKYENIKVVKTYPKKDIAILKIMKYSESGYLKLHNPSDIKKGHVSYSLGYPGGSDLVGDSDAHLDSTIKSGDVSKIFKASSRDPFPNGYKLIETSSDINGGNSGGPLLSRMGTLLGINTFKHNDIKDIFSTGQIQQGIFWAIHVEELIEILDSNGIKYSISRENIGRIDLEKNSQIIYAIIAVMLFFLIYIMKKRTTSHITPSQISRIISRKIKDQNIDKNALVVLRAENSKSPKIELNTNKIILGRSNNANIRISSSRVSGKHLTLEARDGIVYVVDLDSTNGTYIDGKKLNKYVEEQLNPNQRLIIGSEDVVYRVHGYV